MEDRVGPWPDPCTCIPGSELEGWQEVRSPECQAHERKIWKDFFENKVPATLEWARKKRLAREQAEALSKNPEYIAEMKAVQEYLYGPVEENGEGGS